MAHLISQSYLHPPFLHPLLAPCPFYGLFCPFPPTLLPTPSRSPLPAWSSPIFPLHFTPPWLVSDGWTNYLMCPAGHISTSCYSEILYNNKPGYAFQFKPSLCNICLLKAKCVKNKKGRRVYISYFELYFPLARERGVTEERKQAYRNRYKIEQKVADLIRYCRLKRCRYCRFDKAKIHTLLSTTVCNIKRIVTLLRSAGQLLPWVTNSQLNDEDQSQREVN